MDNNRLALKWENFSSFQTKKGFKALRISAECRPDLFLAIDEDGNRCLLLFLNSKVPINFQGGDKEKLQLTFLKSQNILMIKLKDLEFIDLFNDLIVSLYLRIKNISDPEVYSQRLIYSFFKWAEFFENNSNSRLSFEEIKGLVGELFFLNQLLENANHSTINIILESWQGPFGTANDFIFDDRNVEVKTKEDSKTTVKISSEHQLETEYGKKLELLILSMKIDMMNGNSLFDLFQKAVDLSRKYQGNLGILLLALNQKGLTLQSLKEYNNHRFKISKSYLFDCTSAEFPKLSTSNIPQEVSKLRYTLQTNMLNDFLIEEKHF